MPIDDTIANNGSQKSQIIADKCKGCTVCIKKCPNGAITGERKAPHIIDPEKCSLCGECAKACKFDAVIGAASTVFYNMDSDPQPYRQKMLEMLDRLCEGRGKPEDSAILEAVSRRVKTTPNIVLSTLQCFCSEFEAFACGDNSAQITYLINEDCTGCSICTRHCPVSAIPPVPYRQHCIDTAICTKCDECRQHCPHTAIMVVTV